MLGICRKATYNTSVNKYVHRMLLYDWHKILSSLSCFNKIYIALAANKKIIRKISRSLRGFPKGMKLLIKVALWFFILWEDFFITRSQTESHFQQLLTFCVCSSLYSFSRSCSSRTHRRYVNGIHGINFQVGQCCGICRIDYNHGIRVTLQISWVMSNHVTDGLSVEIFFW